MFTLSSEDSLKGKPPSERTIEELLHNSLVVIDKPVGPTSHEVAAFAKKILGLKKAGHSGTLDYNVSGVLPVLLDNATKAAGFLLKQRKEYVCLMKTGGEVSRKDLDAVFSRFKGKIYQTPPLASAVVKKLRVREVFSIEVLEHEKDLVLFKANVEAGTYLRTICFHVGEVLGCGAEMVELRRTLAAGFTEKGAVTLQELTDFYWLWKEKGDDSRLRNALVPLEAAVHLKKVVASDGALKPITTGANLAIPGILALDEGIKKDDYVQILTGCGELACFAKAFMSTQEIAKNKNGMAFDIERVVTQF